MVGMARLVRRAASNAGYAGSIPPGGADTAGPRPGFTTGEELRGLFGFRSVPVPTRGAAADRLMENQLREMQHEVQGLGKADPYQYVE